MRCYKECVAALDLACEFVTQTGLSPSSTFLCAPHLPYVELMERLLGKSEYAVLKGILGS
ncbi:hypothetical protein MCOR25_007375 [Pyricularia grisea]|nr:hypothetical protein MCOR25_007375 [Pyricularia grisea]